MDRISRYLVITSRSVIADHEVEASSDRLIGPSPQPIRTIAHLDWGVAKAFGRRGGFRVSNQDGNDVTNKVRSSHPRGAAWFDVMLAAAELRLNRQTIEGPASPAENANLRRRGQPVRGSRGHDSAGSARDRSGAAPRQGSCVAARSDARRGGDTRDRHRSSRRGLAARNAGFDELTADEQRALAVLAEMPSFDVAVSMKASYHRDGNHTWRPNDINDIDVLGSSLPYCDVVVTDKKVAHMRRVLV